MMMKMKTTKMTNRHLYERCSPCFEEKNASLSNSSLSLSFFFPTLLSLSPAFPNFNKGGVYFSFGVGKGERGKKGVGAESFTLSVLPPTGWRPHSPSGPISPLSCCCFL